MDLLGLWTKVFNYSDRYRGRRRTLYSFRIFKRERLNDFLKKLLDHQIFQGHMLMLSKTHCFSSSSTSRILSMGSRTSPQIISAPIGERWCPRWESMSFDHLHLIRLMQKWCKPIFILFVFTSYLESLVFNLETCNALSIIIIHSWIH